MRRAGPLAVLMTVVLSDSIGAEPPPVVLYSFPVFDQTGSPQGIDIAPDGSLRVGVDIYVAHYTPDGTLVRFNNPGSCSAAFGYPSGVAVRSDGTTYVADQDTPFCVTVFDDELNTIGGLGDSSIAVGLFGGPSDVAVAPGGMVYVSDAYFNRIWQFDSDGTLVRTWGEPGTGPAQFNGPNGIGVGGAGDVYVSDAGNNRVQRFTASGEYVGSWATPHPYDLDVTSDGDVVVLAGSHEIRKYNSRGLLIWEFTDDICWSSICIALNLAADDFGQVFVSLTSDGRVLVLGPPPVQVQSVTWGRVKANYR